MAVSVVLNMSKQVPEKVSGPDVLFSRTQGVDRGWTVQEAGFSTTDSCCRATRTVHGPEGSLLQPQAESQALWKRAARLISP